jgi:methyl-accepting chemotaxis protein
MFMTKLSIGGRILLAATLIVVFAFSAFTLYFDYNQRAAIRQSLRSEVDATAALASAGIVNWIDGRRSLIESLGQSIATDDTRDAVRADVSRQAFVDNFMFSYFGSASGEMTMHPDGNLPEDYDPRKRPWYKDAVEAGNSTLTEPYQDVSTGKLIVTVTSPVKRDGGISGVVGGDIDISVLAELVRSVDLGGVGYAFLVNDKGIVLIHPDKKLSLKPLTEAFPGNTPSLQQGSQELMDGSGDTMFAFFPIEGLPTVKWKLGIAIDRDAAFAALSEFRVTAITTTVVAVLAIIGLLGLLVSFRVSKPIRAMTTAMSRLADGDLTADIPGKGQKDEIGEMAAAVHVFKENAAEKARMEAEREEMEKRAEDEKRTSRLRLADQFETSVGEVVEQVSNAATYMRSSSDSMSATAERATRQSAAVAAASEEASSNVQTVATAAEELSASIGEISRQVSQASQIASGAVQQAQATNIKVQGLADAAQKIGEVVALITDIADQTNLLALNATIEAARAGDAGKGFAVVASEVKNLANQTAKATEEIGAQISGIQTATQEAVEAIAAIGKTISEIDEVAAGIASAVEEQGAATQEIARNVEQAAAGTHEVSSNIAGVSQAANDTGSAASQINSAASELSEQSVRLRSEVDKFLQNVRAT